MKEVTNQTIKTNELIRPELATTKELTKTNKPNKKFLGLSDSERSEIAILLSKSYSLRSIARSLGRSPNTISYEVRTNSVSGSYDPIKAKVKSRALRKRRRWQWMKLSTDHKLQDFVKLKLKAHWSPEEIAGYLKNSPELSLSVSAPNIYKWLYSSRGQAYCQYLYSKRYNKKPRKNNKTKRVMIPDRISITERPEAIDNRIQPGHLEFDSVVSSKRSGSKYALAVIQDRTTRLVRAKLVPNLKPRGYSKVILSLTKGLKILSLTTDNGIENKDHQSITKNTGAPVFFTDPYSSWQKGGVENANKMIRRYFPKGTDFSKITQAQVDQAIALINQKPRKILGFKSAIQCSVEKGLIL